ncbi:MAG: GNAT family N-acetyltransferase [Candidatus Aminicenantes bacterium]|nr:GNAT family N-acetyltransferase [Candidatus Aminicenantes bacterium]
MTIEIKEVKTNKDLKNFVLFPFSHYRDNDFWVPPLIKNEIHSLRPDKNPAFDYCNARFWLAYKNNRLVGRIGGIYNEKFIAKWNINFSNFTRFDFTDDKEVSGALLEKVRQWSLKQGAEGMHGPLGFTNFDQQGMLIKGFEEVPTIASVYNFDYYPRHMEHFGFEKEIDYVEYEVKSPEKIPEKAERLSQIVLKRFHLRLFKAKSKKELLPYAEQIFDVVNKSYRDIFYAVELSKKQIEIFKKQYLSYIDPDFVSLVLDKNDNVVGFAIIMASLSEAFQKAGGRLFPFGFIHILRALKNPKKLDLYLVGIIPEYQNKGVNAAIMADLTQTALQKGIQTTETNSELETNKKVQAFWRYYDARLHKRKRVYKRAVSSSF